MNELTFTKAKKKREELKLPQLHFVVTDDWINKLGHDAFVAWLKFHTWVDRTDEAETKFGNKSTIPRSLEDVWEALGMKKTKFYQKVIHPLWNYGLIDIVEWKDSKKIGQKPKNVIVYEYPQNEYELAVKPLEKCRDYKTDYSTEAAIFGRKGGRPKKEEEVIKSNRSQKQTVIEISKNVQNLDDLNRSQMETVDRSQIKTVTVRKQKPNNYTNTIYNESNTYINESNLSIHNEINKLDVPDHIKEVMHKNKDRLIDEQIDIQEIEYFYKSYQDKINEFKLRSMIQRVLTHTKKKIENINNVLESTVSNELTAKNGQVYKPVREEMKPEFLKKQKQEQQDQSAQNTVVNENDEEQLKMLLDKYKN